MPKKTFDYNSPDMKKLKKFFKKAPHLLKPVSANVLNSLAFTTKKYDHKNLSDTMTIRNERFVKSAIRVQMAKPSKEVEDQKAFVYSIKKKGFTGFKEQQTGKRQTRKRSDTTYARGGNKRGKIKNKYRLKKSNKFYKPQQFQGKTMKQRFYFMMRVLGSRGGGMFLLSQDIPTKRGAMGKGLYELKKGNIKRVQKFEEPKQPRKTEWRTKSLQQLVSKNDIAKVYRKSLSMVIKKRGLRKK